MKLKESFFVVVETCYLFLETSRTINTTLPKNYILVTVLRVELSYSGTQRPFKNLAEIYFRIRSMKSVETVFVSVKTFIIKVLNVGKLWKDSYLY
jgi:hypothetical protein